MRSNSPDQEIFQQKKLVFAMWRRGRWQPVAGTRARASVRAKSGPLVPPISAQGSLRACFSALNEGSLVAAQLQFAHSRLIYVYSPVHTLQSWMHVSRNETSLYVVPLSVLEMQLDPPLTI